MQRKWIVLCSRGRPQLISYPRKWFDSCMHPRPERWCWLRRAAAGLRAGYTWNPRADCAGRPSPQRQSREWWEGKQTQTRPSCRRSRVPLHWPEVPRGIFYPVRRCQSSRRWPGQDVCPQHPVPGAAPPPGPRRVRPAPRPRGRAFYPIECAEHKSGGHPVSGACPQAPKRPRRRIQWKCT